MQSHDDHHLCTPQPDPHPCGCPADTPFLAIHTTGVHIVIARVPRWVVVLVTTAATSVLATVLSLFRR